MNLASLSKFQVVGARKRPPAGCNSKHSPCHLQLLNPTSDLTNVNLTNFRIRGHSFQVMNIETWRLVCEQMRNPDKECPCDGVTSEQKHAMSYHPSRQLQQETKGCMHLASKEMQYSLRKALPEVDFYKETEFMNK